MDRRERDETLDQPSNLPARLRNGHRRNVRHIPPRAPAAAPACNEQANRWTDERGSPAMPDAAANNESLNEGYYEHMPDGSVYYRSQLPPGVAPSRPVPPPAPMPPRADYFLRAWNGNGCGNGQQRPEMYGANLSFPDSRQYAQSQPYANTQPYSQSQQNSQSQPGRPRNHARRTWWTANGNRGTDLGNNAYRYDNYGTDGGYFYRNADGSTYHYSPAKGGTYTPPPGRN